MIFDNNEDETGQNHEQNKSRMRFEAESGWLCGSGSAMKMREDKMWGATNGACVKTRWLNKTQNVTQIVSQIMIHSMTENWVRIQSRAEIWLRIQTMTEIHVKIQTMTEIWEFRPWPPWSPPPVSPCYPPSLASPWIGCSIFIKNYFKERLKRFCLKWFWWFNENQPVQSL